MKRKRFYFFATLFIELFLLGSCSEKEDQNQPVEESVDIVQLIKDHVEIPDSIFSNIDVDSRDVSGKYYIQYAVP